MSLWFAFYAAFSFSVEIEIGEDTLTYRDWKTSFVLHASDEVSIEHVSGEATLTTSIWLMSEKGRIPVNESFEDHERYFRDLQRLWPSLPNLFLV